jgi:predicted component of type VI protein secretion system
MGAALNGPFGPVPLGASVITVGRAPDNQLALQDPQASSHHAEIRPEGSGYSIIDRGSTNGTFINEQRIAPQMPRILNAGDRIRIGSTVFTYEMDGAGAFAATVAADSASGQEMAGGAAYANYGQWPSQLGRPGGSPQNSPYAPPQPAAPAYAPPSAPQAPGYPPQPGFANYQQPPAYPQAPGLSNFGQAPGYPPQPGFPPPLPQTPQPKGSNTGLIVGLVVLAVLVVGGLSFLVLRGHGNPNSSNTQTATTSSATATPAATPTPVSTPEQTLTTYCNAIKSGDYNTAYNQFSSAQQSKETEQQYAANVAKATAQAGKPTDCTFTNVQTNGDTGTATLNLTFSNLPAPVNTKINLIKENGIWKMNGGTVQQPQTTQP